MLFHQKNKQECAAAKVEQCVVRRRWRRSRLLLLLLLATATASISTEAKEAADAANSLADSTRNSTDSLTKASNDAS